MAIRGLHHVAVAVPDLEEAEEYYLELFDMAVLFREGTLEGRRGKLPDGIDWATATAHGVDPHRSVLGRDEFALALTVTTAANQERTGRIGLAIDLDDLGPIAGTAASMGCGVEERETAAVVTDRYGIEWELTAEGFPPAPRYDTLEI